jgi:hypothetical protein
MEQQNIKMIKCLECGKECKNNRSLSSHISSTHMPIVEYRKKYKLNRTCVNCESELSKKNKSGFCNHCRDRSGEKNPAYGKSYPVSDETKKKQSKISKALWQQEWYREKIINGVSKPRREGFAEEQRERTIQWYEENPEQKVLRSECMKKSWREGLIIPNHTSCNRSKMELD